MNENEMIYEVIFTKGELLEIKEDPYTIAFMKAREFAQKKGMILLERDSLINDGNRYIYRFKIAKAKHSSDSEEAPPIPNGLPHIWDLVIADMRDRDSMGFKKYGTHLQPFNGRNPLWDAYQESLDQAVYIRQAIYESEVVDVEKLAEYAHNAWAGWMTYLFSKGTYNKKEGTFTIPKWAVDRWKRQAATLYNDLPEEEKKSDRVEAEKILKIINHLGG